MLGQSAVLAQSAAAAIPSPHAQHFILVDISNFSGEGEVNAGAGVYLCLVVVDNCQEIFGNCDGEFTA